MPRNHFQLLFGFLSVSRGKVAEINYLFLLLRVGNGGEPLKQIVGGEVRSSF